MQLSPEAIPFAPSDPRTGQQVDSLKNFAFDSAPQGRISGTATQMEAERADLFPPSGAGTGLAFDMWPGFPRDPRGDGTRHATLPDGVPGGSLSRPLGPFGQEQWMPQRSTGHTQLQASALLGRLNAWEGSKASNPYWGRFFWQEVS